MHMLEQGDLMSAGSGGRIARAARRKPDVLRTISRGANDPPLGFMRDYRARNLCITRHKIDGQPGEAGNSMHSPSFRFGLPAEDRPSGRSGWFKTWV